MHQPCTEAMNGPACPSTKTQLPPQRNPAISALHHTAALVQSILVLITDAPNCELCEEALKHLEDIDDDADAVGVRMVMTDDKEFVKMYGIEEFPTVVYFEKDNPHIYNGNFGFFFGTK